MVPNPEGEVKDSGKALQTLGENKVAELLKTKDNDTLYVTNFFATWCGPCMIEIPYFKTEMEKLKGEKVKFTFVSVDQPEDWNTKVKEFGNIQGLSSNIVLFDMGNASPEFAKTIPIHGMVVLYHLPGCLKEIKYSRKLVLFPKRKCRVSLTSLNNRLYVSEI